MIDSPEINGRPPMLAGEIVEALLSQEYWHGGELTDSFNAIFLCFNNTWHRLSFDCGIIFWRVTSTAPISFEAPELRASYRIVDLGIRLGVTSKRLARYEMRAIPDGSRVEFTFSCGQSVVFQNVDDHTTLVEWTSDAANDDTSGKK